MKLNPIQKIGGSRNGTLIATYDAIVEVLGEPNTTHLDDAEKVKASWGFSDESGREAFIWCYLHHNPKLCEYWSVDGNMELLRDLFPGNISQ